MPTTRPRRATNQRVATVAPSTSAVMPVPMPTTTPHSSTSCQTCVIASEATRPSRDDQLRRRARRCAGRSGSSARRRTAPSARTGRSGSPAPRKSPPSLQPNSFCSGTMKTPGAPTAPAVISAVRKVTADHHPAVMDVAAGERGGEPGRDHAAVRLEQDKARPCPSGRRENRASKQPSFRSERRSTLLRGRVPDASLRSPDEAGLDSGHIFIGFDQRG